MAEREEETRRRLRESIAGMVRDDLNRLAVGDLIWLTPQPDERSQRHGAVVRIWWDDNGERQILAVWASAGTDMTDDDCPSCGANPGRRWRWRLHQVCDADIVEVTPTAKNTPKRWQYAAAFARCYADNWQTLVGPTRNREAQDLLGWANQMIAPAATRPDISEGRRTLEEVDAAINTHTQKVEA